MVIGSTHTTAPEEQSASYRAWHQARAIPLEYHLAKEILQLTPEQVRLLPTSGVALVNLADIAHGSINQSTACVHVMTNMSEEEDARRGGREPIFNFREMLDEWFSSSDISVDVRSRAFSLSQLATALVALSDIDLKVIAIQHMLRQDSVSLVRRAMAHRDFSPASCS